VTEELLRSAQEVLSDIENFGKNFESQLPERAQVALKRLLNKYHSRSLEKATGLPGIQAVLTLLAAFRGEFNYLLSDIEVVGRSLVARAFTHLRRSIVADDEFRNRWKRAFQEEGETACERLGAVHLLLHGVWAFKASGVGERTDLVLGEPLRVTDDVYAAANALVSHRMEGYSRSKNGTAAESRRRF